MKTLLWIGVAGAVGSASRLAMSSRSWSEIGFPINTLIINVLGTFLLCFLVAGVFTACAISQPLQDVLTIGFLGSFTTFSAFSIETIELFERGDSILALGYIVISLIGGLCIGLIGLHLGGKMVNK